jgi:hypothetical protein
MSQLARNTETDQARAAYDRIIEQVHMPPAAFEQAHESFRDSSRYATIARSDWHDTVRRVRAHESVEQALEYLSQDLGDWTPELIVDLLSGDVRRLRRAVAVGEPADERFD